jgi:membrane associated rhomboid family serine protease
MPWVSLSLIGLNLIVFLLMLGGESGSREHALSGLKAAEDYFTAHPYLSVPAQLRRRLGKDFERSLEQERAAWTGGLPDPERAAQQQDVFNGLCDEAVAALRAMPLERFGFVPADPRPTALLTSLFVHSGWIHLLGNMWFLFLVGPFLEDVYGRPLFLGLYLASGLIALAAHVASAPDSVVPLVGASGAIAGIMGGFLVRLANARIQFLVLPVPILWMMRFRVFLPAFVVLPLWFVEQVIYARSAGAGSGVAFWAHVGGFMFGFAAAVGIKLLRVEERWVNPTIESKTTLSADPDLERAADARRSGQLDEALGYLDAVQSRQPDNPDAWSERYEIALERGDAAETGRCLVRLSELHQRAGEGELLRQLLYDERWRDLDVPVRARMLAASQFEKHGDGQSALAEYDRIVMRFPSDSASLRALVRRGALLQRGGDLRGAREAYTRARAHAACTDPWPGTIDRALAEIDRLGGR